MVKPLCGPPSAFGINYVFQCSKCQEVYLREDQANACCVPRPEKKQEKPKIEVYPHGEVRKTTYTVKRGKDEYRVMRMENSNLDGTTYSTYDVRKMEDARERTEIIQELENSIQVDL